MRRNEGLNKDMSSESDGQHYFTSDLATEIVHVQTYVHDVMMSRMLKTSAYSLAFIR